MLSLIRYYLYLWRHPDLRDYLDMGFGIEARYRRCKRYWCHHLSYSKLFIEQFLKDKKFESVAILGAGRLHDVPLAFLAERCKKLHLFDIDPSCEPYWKRIKAQFSGVIELSWTVCDLSDSILKWSAELEKIEPAGIESFLKDRQISSTVKIEGFDLVISLNLLSQIPIHWRDRVSERYKQHHQIKREQEIELPAQMQKALESNLLALENHHLNLLAQSKASYLVLITDREFDYYHNNLSVWQNESALISKADAESLIAIAGFSLKSKDSWLWHIAPQGIEHKDYGVIHRVWAGGYQIK